MSIGLTIRQLRNARNAKAKDVAARAGITASSLCHIETGGINPTDETATRLLSALHGLSPLTDNEREAVKAARVVGILPGAA